MSAAWPLIGHERAERAFLDAYAQGRLHHGWLISGPSGIGKTRLAKRLAAFLLGARGPKEALLDAPASDPVVQKLEADAHPDLRWVTRRPDEKGKVKQDIPVDDIRMLNAFFGYRPALGGWRVGVIDALDELNRAGANALLKTLEEPPTQSVVILVTHGARPVLPTIRSRCRMLALRRLSDGETKDVLERVGAPQPELAATLARGRPGLGLRLAEPSGVAALSAAKGFLSGLPRPRDAVLIEALKSGGADQLAFDAFVGEALAWLADKAVETPRLSSAWIETAALAADARALNIEPAQAIAKLTAQLQRETAALN